MAIPKTPLCSVDIIIQNKKEEIVLIERAHEPFGWALPGGFVDIGETLEEAAVRESKEETGLDVTLKGQLHSYSDPKRDPRGIHTISTVFVAASEGVPQGMDDAKSARWFAEKDIPELCFDHSQIISDYLEGKY